MLRSWRTTLAGVLACIGGTGAFLAFILQTPTPGWVDLFAASSSWCTVMSLGIGHIFAVDVSELEKKADK